MSTKKKAVLITALVVLTLVGFILGQSVNAVIGSPGDQTDPLVTKSYVEAEAGKLQVQIDGLKAEVEKLKTKVGLK